MSSGSAAGLNAICGAFIGLGVVSSVLRLYARKQAKVPILLDDWFIFAALASYVASAACILRMVDMRVLGYSSRDLSPEYTKATSEKFEKLQIIWGALCTVCLATIKLSILFFYRRIFIVHQRKSVFHWVTIVTVGIVVAWLVTFEFLVGFQCGTHFYALWDGEYNKYCTISFPYLYGLAVSDFLLDVWILLMPIPCIMRLNASPMKKVNIGGVFLLAFVGLGASIARMVEYINIIQGGHSGLFSSDHERALSQSFYLAMLEAGMSLVAANLPSLWLLICKATPENIARSVRSIFSLHSLGRSGGSGGPGSRQPEDPEGSAGLTQPSKTRSKSTSSGPRRSVASSGRDQPVPGASEFDMPEPPVGRVLVRGDVEQSWHDGRRE